MRILVSILSIAWIHVAWVACSIAVFASLYLAFRAEGTVQAVATVAAVVQWGFIGVATIWNIARNP